jgi:hypothetical protein
MFHIRHKTLSESNLNDYLIYLTSYKDILTKIKYTVEVLALIKIILIFITNAAFIPVFFLSIYLLLRKIFIFSSLFVTSNFMMGYFTNDLNYISKIKITLIKVKLTIKDLILKAHNYLFNDELISIKDVNEIINIYNNGIDEILSLIKQSMENTLQASLPLLARQEHVSQHD